MTVEQLKLAPLMKQRAQELQAYCSNVKFISGRRDVQSQAEAMAKNIITNRQYLHQTYRNAAELQTALDMNPQATTVDEIADVLHDVMVRWTEAEKDKLSDHFAGNAVDIQAMEIRRDGKWHLTEEGRAVADWIYKCPDTKLFLTREAGQVRWHWSCRASAAV